MKGFKPFPLVGFMVVLCALMTACGVSHPTNGPAALIIQNTMLPNGVQGIAYNQVLTVTGGQSPFFWSVKSGALPKGLNLTTGGELTGVVDPTAMTSSFTVQVTDSQTPVAAIATQSFKLVINPPLAIGTTTLPQASINLPYPSTTLMATGGLAPFTWSIAAGTLPPGLMLSSSGVISGTPTQTGTFSFTVQANDADSETATAPLSITITGLLQGSNTFYMNGFDNNLPFYVVGSFVADGNGNITSGVLDENGTDAIGLLTAAPILPGSNYSVTSNPSGNGSLGVMVLYFNTPSGVVARNYALAFAQDGNVHLIETDANMWASGLLQPQALTGVTLASLAGSYAYGFIGNDALNMRYAGAGAFNTTIPPTNGTEDTNDNGTVQSDVPTQVTLLTLDTASGTGRGTLSVVSGATTRNYVFYVVNPTAAGLVAVQTDSAPVLGTTLATIVTQIGGTTGGGGSAAFDDAALNAQAVMQLNAIHNNLPDESLGVASFDGKGNLARTDSAPPYFLDENQGGTDVNADGTLQGQSCTGGTYNVVTNGRTTVQQTGCTGLPVPPVVWYLINNNRGFVIGQDAGVTAGVFEPQSGGGPFTNSSILPGDLLGGTVTPVLPSQTNELQSTAAFANGLWSYTYVANGPSGPMTTQTNVNIGWVLDQTNGATLGKWGMGVVINMKPVTTQVAYTVTAIPAMGTTTAQKMVVLDSNILNAAGTAVTPQTNPRLIYLEH